jgi:hypothetical protein
MVTRGVAVVAVLALATAAHADSPKLAQARTAIDEVRFDDAQRLLVGALAEGGNSPAAVREIYKLSARTAVVLGQREIGEQYYRRWLALDPSASLGADVAPKLREPFEAAQAYIAAHGRMSAMATRISADVLDVAVTDPLAMAVSATIVGGTPVPLSAERRARLAPPDAGSVVIAVLDDRGNKLVELAAGPAAADVIPELPQDPADDPYAAEPTPSPPQLEQPEAGPSRLWLVFAVPSAVFLVTGAGFAVAAVNDRDIVDSAIETSTTHVYTEVADRQKRSQTFTALGGTALGIGVILAVPAAVLFFRTPKDRRVIPFVGRDSAGASLVGQF